MDTDLNQERNVVLSRAYEYRQPSASAWKDAAAKESATAPGTPVTLNMTSRFLGLVVLPGHEITSIAVEDALRVSGTSER
ncbi:Like-Sm (LSM) domain [Lasallia pustulata]|uniref:Like-Sm (LSM) domain n=1 Tax=Lasallia pustulata TaxID=136370 RepID=A0A1W5D2J6_9LECA|nr:Like-Sm (LSM) domain [Lasallia pustulata]